MASRGMSDTPEMTEAIYKVAQSDKGATICKEKKNQDRFYEYRKITASHTTYTDWFVQKISN